MVGMQNKIVNKTFANKGCKAKLLAIFARNECEKMIANLCLDKDSIEEGRKYGNNKMLASLRKVFTQESLYTGQFVHRKCVNEMGPRIHFALSVKIG